MIKIFIVMLICISACNSDESDYEKYLKSLPTVSLQHQDQAINIVSEQMGVDPSLLSINWVVAPIHNEQEAVDGVAIDCDLWVLWWSASWLSGASADGPAISSTALTHEIAHCALWLQTGNPDEEHTEQAWWGRGGKVELANKILAKSGL